MAFSSSTAAALDFALHDEELRLTRKRKSSMFNVVLVEPEIPPNTGNIGRLCLGNAINSAPD